MSSESRLGGPRTTSKSLAPQVNCAEGPNSEKIRSFYFKRVSIGRKCGALGNFFSFNWKRALDGGVV